MTSAADLRRWALETPHLSAVVFGKMHLSYAELEALANRYARVFESRGLARGDHLVSLCGNRPEALGIAWGAYRCGLYLTPMPTTLALPEAVYMVGNAEAKLVVVDAALAELGADL
jgi:long-chain acyl-CoA synthetase